MKISEFLRASFVGALLFTPAMADDIEKVHEEALRVLREKLGQTDSSLPTAPGSNGSSFSAPQLKDNSEAARLRSEREARIKVEAQQRIVEREKVQAEHRQQFEQWIKEREKLRQQQRVYDENAALQTGQIQASADDDLHLKALEALHRAEAQGSGVAPNSTTAVMASPTRVAQVNVAPALMSSSTQAAPASVQSNSGPALISPDSDAIHAQALEALHQMENGALASTPQIVPSITTRTSAPTVTAAPRSASPAPQPSPELQMRLKQMQLELEQEQMEKSRASAASTSRITRETAVAAPMATEATSISDAYVKDLEQRARASVQSPIGLSTTSPTPSAPVLDPGTRDMIRRQNEEIARRMRPNASTPSASVGSSNPATTQGLTATQEEQARTTLRQQQSARAIVPATAVTAPRLAASAQSAPAIAGVSHRTETDTSDIQYSRDLEERARQALAERAQNQQTTALQASPPSAAIATSPVESNPTSVPSVAPVQATIVTPVPAAAATPFVAPIAPATPSTPISSPGLNNSSDAISDVHAQALDALNKVQPGTGAKTRQQRIKEITDLYRADKMGPAEYHQKRAQILAEPQ